MPDDERTSADKTLSEGEAKAYLEALLRKSDQDRRMQNEIAALRTRGFLHCLEVKNPRVERIVDPSGAAEIVDRREKLNRSSMIAQAIYEQQQLRKPDLMNQVEVDVPNNGAVLETKGYSLADIQSKIAHADEYVLVHAGAVIRDPDTLLYRPFQYVADIQVQVATADPTAPLITKVPHPDEDTEFHAADKERARRIAGMIHAHHGIIAVITDVVVHPREYRDRRLASRTRVESFKIIAQELNPKRPGSEVQMFIANMFRIEALRLLDGTRYPLAYPLINRVSIYRHAVSTQFDAFLGWRVKSDDIATEFTPEGSTEPIQGVLETGWEAAVMLPRGRH